MTEKTEFALTATQYHRLRELVGATCVFPTDWEQNGTELVVTMTYATWNPKYEEHEEEEQNQKEHVPIIALSSDEAMHAYAAYRHLLACEKDYAHDKSDLAKETQKAQDLTQKIQQLSQQSPLDTYQIETYARELRDSKCASTSKYLEALEKTIAQKAVIEAEYRKFFPIEPSKTV